MLFVLYFSLNFNFSFQYHFFVVVVPWNSFLLMCKMWLKTSLFGSLTLLWFPENATGSFSLMSSLLPTSLFGPSLEQRSLVTVLPGTQGHQLCSPVATKSHGCMLGRASTKGRMPSSLALQLASFGLWATALQSYRSLLFPFLICRVRVT